MRHGTPPWLDQARGLLGQAAHSFGSMQAKHEQTTTGARSLGGGLGAAAGGAMAGASYGAMKGTAISPGVGTIIGAGVGLLGYFL